MQQYFDTDHLSADLKRRAVSGGLIKGIAQCLKLVLNLGSVMILARMLLPEDFGLLAMVLTIMGFVSVFKDAGLSTPTIQRENITHAQVSNLFWINVTLGASMTALLCCGAPLLGWFYNDPRVVPICMILAVNFVASASSVQHKAVLTRQMRFKTLETIDVIAITAGFATAIGMALGGFGYWSLVFGNLTTEVSILVMVWIACGWRPSWWTRNCGVGSLVGFGANITLASLIFTGARGMDQLLIGRVWGPASVGLYSRATVLLVRPLQQMLFPLGDLVVPVLSRLQSDAERYRRVFLEVNNGLALLAFTGSGLLIPIARPVTLVLLGPRFEGTAPIFAGFAVAAGCITLGHASSWLFTSQGRGGDLLRTTVVAGLMTIASFLAGLPFGPVGVATAWAVSGLTMRVPYLYYRAGRRGPVSTSSLILGVARNLPVGLATFAATAGASLLVAGWQPVHQLAVCVPTGLVAAAVITISMRHSRQTVVRVIDSLAELLRQRRHAKDMRSA